MKLIKPIEGRSSSNIWKFAVHELLKCFLFIDDEFHQNSINGTHLFIYQQPILTKSFPLAICGRWGGAVAKRYAIYRARQLDSSSSSFIQWLLTDIKASAKLRQCLSGSSSYQSSAHCNVIASRASQSLTFCDDD